MCRPDLTFQLERRRRRGRKPVNVQPPATTDPLSADRCRHVAHDALARDQDPIRTTRPILQNASARCPHRKQASRSRSNFPPDERSGTAEYRTAQDSSLEVIRFSPEGEVPLAPDLSVTFSQPMVAVTSQEEAAKYAPVELTPQVEGRWRWLGTKTLMFDTDKRFPMATKFTARVPAGTKVGDRPNACRRISPGHSRRRRRRSSR